MPVRICVRVVSLYFNTCTALSASDYADSDIENSDADQPPIATKESPYDRSLSSTSRSSSSDSEYEPECEPQRKQHIAGKRRKTSRCQRKVQPRRSSRRRSDKKVVLETSANNLPVA